MRKTVTRFILTMAVFFGVCRSLAADTPVIALGTLPSLEISNQVELYLDTKGNKTIRDVSRREFPGFKRNVDLFPSPGVFGGIAWLRFALENPSDKEVEQVLLLDSFALDVRLHFLDDQEQFQEQHAGRIYTGQLESFPNALPRFTISLMPHQKQVYYLSIKNTFVYSIKLTINSFEAFYQKQRLANSLAGLFIGVMLIMMLYNLFIYFSTRDVAYLWYVATVLTLHVGLIGQFLLNGDYLGIKSPLFPSIDMWIAKLLATICLIQFSRVFLLTKKVPKLDFFLLANIIISGLFFVLSIFYPLAQLNAVHNIFVSTSIISLIIYSGLLFSQGFRYARYYFIAWFPLLLVMIGTLAFNMAGKGHLIPNVSYLMCLSACAEVLLLSMALADKFNQIRQAHERAEKAHKVEVLAMNISLEARVKEKTRDVRSMLDSLKLGIFTINHEFNVNQEYSKYLSTMVSTHTIETNSALKILFEDALLGHDTKDQVEAAIGASIEVDEMGYEGNAHLLVRQFQKKRGEELRDIEVDWSPIQNEDGVVKKLLVSIKDVTELNHLKKDGAKQKRCLDILSEFLATDSHQFHKLELQFKKLIHDTKMMSHMDLNIWSDREKAEYVSQLFAKLHTDKAISRKLKLSFLSDAIHEGENYLQDVKQGKATLNLEIVQRLMSRIEQSLEEYAHVIASFGLRADGSLAAVRDRSIETLIMGILSERISLAATLGKSSPLVKLDIPDLIELDSQHEQTLETFLIHCLRNSMDHGIEVGNIRRSLAKAEQGLISLSAKKIGNCYVIEYGDDGRGLDLDQIYAKALERGLAASEKPYSKEEIAQFIFDSGFSTKDRVSEISGRGVGLDAVRRQVMVMGGDIEVQVLEQLESGSFGRWSASFRIQWPCEGQISKLTG